MHNNENAASIRAAMQQCPPRAKNLNKNTTKKAPPPGPYRANNTKQRCSRLTYMHSAVYEIHLKTVPASLACREKRLLSLLENEKKKVPSDKISLQLLELLEPSDILL